ncbi:MAG: GEVED domain-containing protein, partial [Bacteroidota bacterium]
DLDKYGRVKWAWDGQTIQSIAVSGWTTEAPSFTDRDYTTSVLSFFVAPVTFSTHTADPEFDFGDLPDGIGNVDYPTLLASNGPRHTIVDQCFLGQGIDAEGDAQTSLDAEGDDIAGTDDEDGVTFGDAQWTPGTTTNITLAVNRLGCLDAAASCWADFNGDGDFNDAGENIISGVSSGTYAVDVPNSVTGGAVAVRCRLASDAGLTPVGSASDGEVEDYFQPVASLDYGDLGTNDNGTDYPTLFADSGPRHVIVSECLLGQAIDAEADGQPDANAEGDDNAGTDDEDGIQFLTGQIDEGQIERLAATGVTTGCAEALLYCWADFNDDASFNDEEELIVNAQPLSASPFEYTVPEEIASTSIGVRCRLSNDAAAASPTGTAPNGEVEDYTVESSLPVELSAFELEPLGSRVALTWSTLTETNNAGFEIQTNHNGSGFEALSFIDGVGTTVEAQSYTWTSGDLQPGIYQFRLKQIDFDGQFAYSPVVEAVIGVPDQAILEPAYPNPFNPTTNIRFTVADRADVAVWLYDTTGRQVRQLFEGQVEAGRTQAISVDATDLPSGVYLIRLEGSDFTESQKVMLMK